MRRREQARPSPSHSAAGAKIFPPSGNYQQTPNRVLALTSLASGALTPPPQACCVLEGFLTLWLAPLSTRCGDPEGSAAGLLDR